MSDKKGNDLYERELTRFRSFLDKDKNEALERYGMTLIYSLNPAERSLALKDWGIGVEEPVDFYNIGVSLALQENWSEAIVHFKKALEQDANLTDAIYNLAVCYEKTGHVPQAKATWEVFVDASQNDSDVRAVQKHLQEI